MLSSPPENHGLATQGAVDFLRIPGSYPEKSRRVDVVETHISWIFLTDRFAYKLKKPVRFEFLDFSTPAARRLACEEEVHLNQRLAHDVYLGVVPITQDANRGLQLGGQGPAVDYVVKMRRLPAERALDQRIRQGQLAASDVQVLSRFLIKFYTRLPPKVLQVDDHYRRLVCHCQGNYADLQKCLEPTRQRCIRRVMSAQQRYLTLQKPLFYDRVRNGRVVEGHGDLRAEHIYLDSPPRVIDCVEFSRELRIVDVLDELSFLAMDCQRLGNSRVGQQLLHDYAERTGDQTPDSLAAFYKSYRACVRAKVSALRAKQAEGSQRRQAQRQTHQYLSWAHHYAAQLGPPALVVVGGVMGSGKSTLAAELARSIGAEWLSTDSLRRQLFGRSRLPARYGADHYSDAARQQVYELLLARAANLLDSGCSVVVDGTFLTNNLRRMAFELGRQHGARTLLILCVSPKAVALERIRKRAAAENADSEARPELYDQQQAQFEPLDPSMTALRINSASAFSEELGAASTALRRLLGFADK